MDSSMKSGDKCSALLAVARAMGFSAPAVALVGAVLEQDGWVPLPDAARMFGLSRQALHKWSRAGLMQKQSRTGHYGSLVYLPEVRALVKERAVLKQGVDTLPRQLRRAGGE